MPGPPLFYREYGDLPYGNHHHTCCDPPPLSRGGSLTNGVHHESSCGGIANAAHDNEDEDVCGDKQWQ